MYSSSANPTPSRSASAASIAASAGGVICFAGYPQPYVDPALVQFERGIGKGRPPRRAKRAAAQGRQERRTPMTLAIIHLYGNLGRDAELRYTQSGNPVLHF